jgi:DNA-binding MarR family transcriptional regulator
VTRPTHYDPSIAALARLVEVSLDDLGLTIQKYRVLIHLARGPLSPSDLADRLAVRPPTVTRLVDGLVEKGLVVRRPDSTDGRRSVHDVTPAGTSLLQAAALAIDAVLDDIGAELDEDERASAAEGLRLWGEAMRRRWYRRTAQVREELHVEHGDGDR